MCLCARLVSLLHSCPKSIIENECVRARGEKSVYLLECGIYMKIKNSRQAQLSQDLCARRSVGECQRGLCKELCLSVFAYSHSSFNLRWQWQKVKCNISLSEHEITRIHPNSIRQPVSTWTMPPDMKVLLQHKSRRASHWYSQGIEIECNVFWHNVKSVYSHFIHSLGGIN